MRTLLSVVFLSLVMVSAALGQSLKCDTSQYKASPGLTAAIDQDALVAEFANWAQHAADVGHIPLHQQALAWGVSKKVKLSQRADNQVLLYWATKQD